MKINLLRSARSLLLVTALALVVAAPVLAQDASSEETTLPNLVLVHGAWADGSSWSKLIPLLQAAGYNVIAPQFPHTSLEANVGRLKQALATVTGPTILVGHSYGGQIISALGEHEQVIGLVYVAAFGLDEGESIGALLAQGEPTPALAHLIIDAQGYAYLPQDDFVTHFASDVDPAEAKAMWAVQQPLNTTALADVMAVPTWKSTPSWYLVATNDEAIPPDVQRLFAGRMGATTVEIDSSHVAMISHPEDVFALIESATTTLASGS